MIAMLIKSFKYHRNNLADFFGIKHHKRTKRSINLMKGEHTRISMFIFLSSSGLQHSFNKIEQQIAAPNLLKLVYKWVRFAQAYGLEQKKAPANNRDYKYLEMKKHF